MTQIYQHEEDSKRGDITISLRLGIKGTFIFTATVFALAMGGFAYFYSSYYHWKYALLFIGVSLPTLLYFLQWAYRAFRHPQAADFRSTMRLNLLSACCTNLFYLIFGLWEHGKEWLY